MINITEQFKNLLEKAVVTGTRKKGNPKYKMAFDKKGHKIWVLVNKEDSDFNHGKELSDEDFHKHRLEGKALIHFDEVPEVNSVEDLEMLTFLTDQQKAKIEVSLKKVNFYKKSIL